MDLGLTAYNTRTPPTLAFLSQSPHIDSRVYRDLLGSHSGTLYGASIQSLYGARIKPRLVTCEMREFPEVLVIQPSFPFYNTLDFSVVSL